MSIPEEAYEAATKALHRYDLQEGLSGYLKPSEHHVAEARAAVEAAAPHIAAQALRDAAEDILTASERMKKNLGPELAQRNGHMFGTRALMALKLHQRADHLEAQP